MGLSTNVPSLRGIILVKPAGSSRTGLDVVICNAGVMAVPQRCLTLDGFEMQRPNWGVRLLESSTGRSKMVKGDGGKSIFYDFL